MAWIVFKVCLLVHYSLHDSAPNNSLHSVQQSVSLYRQHLLSAATTERKPQIAYPRLVRNGNRSFGNSGSITWNRHLFGIRDHSVSLDRFCSRPRIKLAEMHVVSDTALCAGLNLRSWCM